MTIYYYPYPAAPPPTTDPQYVVGDYYINQNNSVTYLKEGTGFAAGKLLWSKYTSASPAMPLSPPPVISSSITSSKTGKTGIAMDFEVASAYGGSGTATGLNLSVSPALPAGLSLSGANTVIVQADSSGILTLYNSVIASISGTPTEVITPKNFTITFTDAAGVVSSKTFSLTIESGIVPLVVTQAVANTNLSQTVSATAFTPVIGSGGTEPLTFSIVPSLPTGLSFNSSTGQISGTPSVPLDSTVFTVTVTDSTGISDFATFNLTVTAPAVTTTLSLASYSITRTVGFTAIRPVLGSGGLGTLTYSISPALSAGLSLNSATGYISGPATETFAATSYAITVTDSNSPAQSSSKSFTLTVNELPALNTTLLVAAQTLTKNVALAGFTPVSASGGYDTLTYSISPSLPAGLSFSTSNGKITGTPTALSSVTEYTVTVNDSASQSSSKTFSLEVTPSVLTTNLAISNRILVQNASFTAFTPVTATGGETPLTFSIDPSLPSGLTFSSTTGQIAGTASTVSSETIYTITVDDSTTQTSSHDFTLEIQAPPVLVLQAIASKTLVHRIPSVAFTPITATGGYGTLTYSISPSLPTGLTFNTSNGSISGTPTSYLVNGDTFTVTVSDQAQQSSSEAFELIVEVQPLTATVSVPNKTLIRLVNTTPFRPVTASAGSEVYTYNLISSLPAGLTFNTNTGFISGTPSVTSTSVTYTVDITDSLNNYVSGDFDLTIENPPPLTTTSTISSSTFYRSIETVSVTPVSASGGYGSLTFAITPSLPNGLNFSAANGKISGIAVGVSNADYTINVSDSVGQSSSENYHLTVIHPLLVTTASVPFTALVRNKLVTTFTPVTSTGGSGGTTFNISPALSTGLSFNSVTGAVSGRPTTLLTTTTYSITATDSDSSTSSTNIQIEVVLPDPLSTTATSATFVLTVGQTVTAFTPVTADGGEDPLAFVIVPSLPTGLNYDTNTGYISGKPNVISNNAEYTVTVTDSAAQSSISSFALSTIATPITLTVTSANVNATIYTQISSVNPVSATGGYGALTYAISGILPAGLTFDTGTGQLRGTPTELLTQTEYTITVTDSLLQSAFETITITVADEPPAPLEVTAAQNPVILTLGEETDISSVIVAGGITPYTFSVLPAELPTGLLFNTNTGNIYGTPIEVATTQTFTVYVTDQLPQTANASFTLAVVADIVTAGKGYTGSRGYTGSQGYTGSRGDTGFIGSQGDLGYTGSEGYTGSQGDTGYTGSAGIDGKSIAIVGTVATSSNLDPGYAGSIGNGYITADTGHLWVWSGTSWTDVGNVTGPKGDTGYTGSQGDTGFVGSQGVDGYTGSEGYTGSQGEIGYVGSYGYTGSKGNVGFVGSLGYTGSQGDIGYVGSTGTDGYTGSAGIDGTNGVDGYTGSKGDPGTGVNILGSVADFASLPSDYLGNIGDGYLTQDNGYLNVWTGSSWLAIGEIRGPIGYTGSGGTGGGVAGGNYDGGQPDSNYGGIASLNAGGVT